MNKKDLSILTLLFLIAFCVRFYDLSYPSFKWMDEAGHVPAATNYWQHGQFEPDNWEHPPLRHIIFYGFLQVFGDNPYGWRLRNVLFGAAAALLTYLFAREISGSRKAGLMAGLLMATDPLHIVLSRFTFEEVYGGAIFLAGLVLHLQHKRRSVVLMLSAFFMGCALATKWYYIPCWFLVYLLTLYEDGNYRKIKTALFITSTYVLIPVAVYLLSYYQWFGRGYSLNELGEFIANSYRVLQSYQPQNYDYGLIFLSHISAGEWFFRPVIVGQGTLLPNNGGEFILYMNSLPVWILTFPAMTGIFILGAYRQNLRMVIPVLFFCATYVLFLFVKRPTFIYSAVPLLPFAFTAIACGITHIAERYSARIYYVAITLMLAWNLYLFPLVTAKKIPMAPYRYIIESPGVQSH